MSTRENELTYSEELLNRLMELGMSREEADRVAGQVAQGGLRGISQAARAELMLLPTEVLNDPMVRAALTTVGLGQLGAAGGSISWSSDNRIEPYASAYEVGKPVGAAAATAEEQAEADQAGFQFRAQGSQLANVISQSGLYGQMLEDIDWSWIHNYIATEYAGVVSPAFLSTEIESRVLGDISPNSMYMQKLEQFMSAGGNNEILVEAFDAYALENNLYKDPKFERVQSLARVGGIPTTMARRVMSAAEQAEVNPFALSVVVGKNYGEGRVNYTPGLRNVDRETGRAPSAREARERFENRAIGDLASELQQWSQQLFNPAMAVFAMIEDPELARRMQADPWGATSAELRRIRDALGPMSSDPDAAAALSWIDQRLSGAFKDVSQQVDTGTVREAARNLAAAWNLPDLGDGWLDSLASAYASQYAVGLDTLYPNPFSDDNMDRPRQIIRHVQGAGAMAADRLRATAGYRELFGNKTDGESEEEYVGRFEQMAGHTFGPGFDGSTEAVRTGMRSGESQDVRTHGIASGEAFDSSTFQGRLASFAQAFRSMT